MQSPRDVRRISFAEAQRCVVIVSMSDIPGFEEAIGSFRNFLAEQGHSTDIFWVFREDIWKRSAKGIVLRFPSQTKNLALAKKVFQEGRKRGVVNVHAVAAVNNKVAATVWFPKFADEEIQGWNQGMKLSIAEPLPTAEMVGQFRWLMFRFNLQFRHYQQFDSWIGTKAWATAQRDARVELKDP